MNKTNEVPVEFSLGAAHLESVPPGAMVFAPDGTCLGSTPLELLDLKPQVAQFKLSLTGYETISVMMPITPDQTNTCRTNLMSSGYLIAMREARHDMAVGDYAGVVAKTGMAINDMPDDADALALQAQANAKLDSYNQKLEQLKRPRKIFDDLCHQDAAAHLFEVNELKTEKSAKAVEAAIAQALKASPQGYQILSDSMPESEIYRVTARQTFSLGILGGTERDCLLVVGQTKVGETQILFRVLDFKIQNNWVNFQPQKQLVPIEPTGMQMSDLDRTFVNDGLRVVTERIRSAIQAVQ